MLRLAILAGKRAQLWATFNEPEVASLCGHITGSHPPGKVMQFKEGGMKLCTMLRAHTAAYKAIKNLPGEFCTKHSFHCLNKVGLWFWSAFGMHSSAVVHYTLPVTIIFVEYAYTLMCFKASPRDKLF